MQKQRKNKNTIAFLVLTGAALALTSCGSSHPPIGSSALALTGSPLFRSWRTSGVDQSTGMSEEEHLAFSPTQLTVTMVCHLSDGSAPSTSVTSAIQVTGNQINILETRANQASNAPQCQVQISAATYSYVVSGTVLTLNGGGGGYQFTAE